MGPADAALDGLGARREEPLLLPLEVRAARRLRRRRRRQHAPLAYAHARSRREQVRRVPRMSVTNIDQIELLKAPGLLVPSRSYKPLRYPWAIEYWRRQQQ